ncbi:unnamed protein product [Clonostachys byssicola]|uniref:Uncharacterized protein n=1 Tax=Clonostachys byssicola TaxID=160290 RepID=A0A9N9XVJ8_9HYPO|nr:unnamed protein product [Clonostachys byssicola]
MADKTTNTASRSDSDAFKHLNPLNRPANGYCGENPQVPGSVPPGAQPIPPETLKDIFANGSEFLKAYARAHHKTINGIVD